MGQKVFNNHTRTENVKSDSGLMAAPPGRPRQSGTMAQLSWVFVIASLALQTGTVVPLFAFTAREEALPFPAPVAGARVVESRSNIMLAYLSTRNSKRMAKNLQYIRENIGSLNESVMVHLVNYTETNSSGNIVPPDSYRLDVAQATKTLRGSRRRLYSSYDLTAKFYFALKYFLEETDIDWFWRGTDDCIINFKTLDGFVQWLYQEHNPREEFVVYGQCIWKLRRERWNSYIQGGSGWVMSRKAAQEIVGYYRWTMQNMKWAEDVVFGTLLQTFFKDQISIRNTTSRFFCGHSPPIKERLMLFGSNLKNLSKCPDIRSVPDGECKRFVTPWADLVFFHEQWARLTFEGSLQHAKLIFNLPRNLQFYMDHSSVRPCIQSD